jgi:hypothetical protein
MAAALVEGALAEQSACQAQDGQELRTYQLSNGEIQGGRVSRGQGQLG